MCSWTQGGHEKAHRRATMRRRWQKQAKTTIGACFCVLFKALQEQASEGPAPGPGARRMCQKAECKQRCRCDQVTKRRGSRLSRPCTAHEVETQTAAPCSARRLHTTCRQYVIWTRRCVAHDCTPSNGRWQQPGHAPKIYG